VVVFIETWSGVPRIFSVWGFVGDVSQIRVRYVTDKIWLYLSLLLFS